MRTNYEVTPEMAQRAAFKQALSILQAAGTNAAAFLAYVTVQDVVEHRAELMAEQPVEDQTPITIDDAIADACECELCDPRDTIIDFWHDVSNMAAKHYAPNGDAL